MVLVKIDPPENAPAQEPGGYYDGQKGSFK